MNAVWLRLRVEARAHWRSWLGVALLVGILTGAAIAAFAGARRTQTALRPVPPRDARVRHRADERQHARHHQPPVRLRRDRAAARRRRRGKVCRTTTATGRRRAGKPIVETDVAPFASDRRWLRHRAERCARAARPAADRAPTRSRSRSLAADRLGVHAGDTLRRVARGTEAAAAGTAAPQPHARRSASSRCRAASRRSPAACRRSALLAPGVLPRRIPTRSRCSRSGCATARAAFPAFNARARPAVSDARRSSRATASR